ncbi:P-loop containing nucleoside triphosphate hydrolase protein [Kockovaella imperatae]|uniref:p-loop containing nucleoside triphosphate hydrolase protein n=1 Tax=Kockovaella imperatae TaxID=4999 RepID=A0A1Y1U6J6_9TREE|nr:P-loop containing nucleoside triphosphate hydrolase protein [Kockovaella imperatae]ORX33638.1 P-loop containing nucleoside triphosphate hydrolase protein [Kockovaella imperatae]
MPKHKQSGHGARHKAYALPSSQMKKDLGVPKIKPSKQVAGNSTARSAALPSMVDFSEHYEAGPSHHASTSSRDSSAKAFMRELRKVIEKSDVIIQVLDARDPEGTRSRWVEDEVRKHEGQGKKLLGVINKIDLVPRANLEAWIKYLRHSFPTMPFKSSTQSQRHHLSQNSVPVASASELPTTASSLGAPALLHLLKQYALSTPHSALTVGVVGYPNVGKSSLINSLKRSRACAVAAMPGKTRVVQEVVLDKGVKIIDCPGVVLEDVGREGVDEESKSRRAEVMLRNCIKPESVDDPISPVEVILAKTQPEQICKLYNIPPYDDVRDFLIKIALTRGRLGKGGIPDLEGSAVSVLRDWNSGKIAYYTKPPAVHPSSAPQQHGDIAMDGDQVGDAKILTTLSEAFTLEGLLDQAGDEAAWEGHEEPTMAVESDTLPTPSTQPIPYVPPRLDSDSESDDDADVDADVSMSPDLVHRQGAPIASKMFTAEELAMLPPSILDRQKSKSQAKKAKKRLAAAERTEGELMVGFMDMGIERQAIDVPSLPSKKQKMRAKKAKAQAERLRQLPSDREADEAARKEQDFAKFLSTVGDVDVDEEL